MFSCLNAVYLWGALFAKPLARLTKACLLQGEFCLIPSGSRHNLSVISFYQALLPWKKLPETAPFYHSLIISGNKKFSFIFVEDIHCKNFKIHQKMAVEWKMQQWLFKLCISLTSCWWFHISITKIVNMYLRRLKPFYFWASFYSIVPNPCGNKGRCGKAVRNRDLSSKRQFFCLVCF